MEPIEDKFRSFGFDTFIAKDGNDFEDIDSAFKQADESSSGKPRCIIARTVKGSGVSFMENRLEWHYLPMNEENYQQALTEIVHA